MGSLYPDTLLQDRYRVRGRPENRGLGEWYRATDERLGVPVLLKRLPWIAALSPQARERRIQMLAGLFHPRLARVKDVVEVDGEHYIVLGDLPGNHADRSVERDGPIGAGRVVGWGIQLLDILHHLHSHDPPLLHLALSPYVLRLSRQDETFLIDPGLLVPFADPAVPAPAREGGESFTYQAPECAREEPADPRSDLYATGAILYYLVTGSAPPDAPARRQAIAERHADPLVPAHTHHALVPAALSRVLSRALSLDPEHRPDSAATMQALLRTVVPGTSPAGDAEQVEGPQAGDTGTISVPGAVAVAAAPATPTGSIQSATESLQSIEAVPEPAIRADALPGRAGSSPPRNQNALSCLAVGVATVLSLALLMLFSVALWIGLTQARTDRPNQEQARLPTPTAANLVMLPGRSESPIEPSPSATPPIAIGSPRPEQAPAGPIPTSTATPPPSPTPEESLPTPTVTIAAAPTGTTDAPPPACSIGINYHFVAVWEQNHQLIGCPVEEGTTIPRIAEQRFEGGSAIWRSDTDEVYIIFDRDKQQGTTLQHGAWRSSPEWVWDGSSPDGVGKTPPPGRYEPVRGFGYVWRTALDAEEGPLGWALEEERGMDGVGQVQRYEKGVMIKGSTSTIYLLLNNGIFLRR